MSQIVLPKRRKKIVYPATEGKPMAENPVQFRWIVTLEGGLDVAYRHDPNVFVAGDLFWYPVEGHPEIVLAPDTMVVFGRPKGDRRSYLQWKEGNIAPQVAFEVKSPGNTRAELDAKFEFYEKYGVQEYYLFDPDLVKLWGWYRKDGRFREIAQMHGWTSPLLGIRFEINDGELQVFGPDGQRFVSYLELAAQRDAEKHAKIAAQAEAARLKEKMRSLGLDPDA